jgi:hypothetical protein
VDEITCCKLFWWSGAYFRNLFEHRLVKWDCKLAGEVPEIFEAGENGRLTERGVEVQQALTEGVEQAVELPLLKSFDLEVVLEHALQYQQLILGVL